MTVSLSFLISCQKPRIGHQTQLHYFSGNLSPCPNCVHDSASSLPSSPFLSLNCQGDEMIPESLVQQTAVSFSSHMLQSGRARVRLHRASALASTNSHDFFFFLNNCNSAIFQFFLLLFFFFKAELLKELKATSSWQITRAFFVPMDKFTDF